MNELKPEDVMRALEHCADYKRAEVSCIGCPIYGRCFDEANLLEKAALALLREKDAEIANYILQIAEMQKQIATQDSELTALMKCKHIEADKDAEIERLRKAKYIYSTVDYCADDFEKASEEIERLRNALAISQEKTKRYMTSHKQIREETIDEFANKVCECRHASSPIVIAVRCAAKEMKGGKS